MSFVRALALLTTKEIALGAIKIILYGLSSIQQLQIVVGCLFSFASQFVHLSMLLMERAMRVRDKQERALLVLGNC